MADDKEQWWTDNHSEGDLSDAFEDAAANKLKQEAELEKAKHALELAKIEAQTAQIQGVSQTVPKSVNETASSIPVSNSPINTNQNLDENSGWKGFWWLSQGELIGVVISTILVFSAIGLLAVSAAGEKDWIVYQGEITGSTDTIWVPVNSTITGVPVNSTITGNGETNGTGWFENWEEIETRNEDCYTDDYGDEYCDVYYTYHDEYTCFADIYLSWEFNGTNYTGWSLSPSYTSRSLCFDEIQNFYQINDTVSLEIDAVDPSKFQVFTIEHGSSTIWTESQSLKMSAGGFSNHYDCYYKPTFTYTVNSVEYTGNFESEIMIAGGGNPCLESVKKSHGTGSQIFVYVNPDNPTDISPDQIEKSATVALMICGPCGILLLIGLFVRARFNNVEPGAYVTRSGSIHHHQGYHPGSDVVIINNNYGRRNGFTHGGYNRPRSRSTNSTSRVSRSSSNRSAGGGRSTGGGRSGGGGRSSGGRRGGGGRR